MSTNSPATAKRRRTPELVRRQALEVGRRLLAEDGPRALTLKAVGAALGMTHANLIHHFGSADAFQARLKDMMVQELTREITAIVADPRPASRDAIVAKVFDAYGRGGIALLMGWSTVTGIPHDEAGLTSTTRELVEALAPRIGGTNGIDRAREIVALVTLLAFADGLIGTALADAVGVEHGTIRRMTAELVGSLAEPDATR